MSTRISHEATFNNHAPGGERRDFRGISVTGDFRAFYKSLDEFMVEFAVIDTRSNLYSWQKRA